MLIDRLFVDWDELETPEEYEIMKKYAENGRRYSLGYSCKNRLCNFHYHTYIYTHIFSAYFFDKIYFNDHYRE